MEEQKLQDNNTVGAEGQTEKTEAPPQKKKSVFRRFLVFNGVIALIWWFNNYTIKATEYTLCSDKITSDMRIAVISDQHASEHSISNEKIADKINRSQPDAVFILGDMYSREGTEAERDIPVKLVEMIAAEGYPVYFVPGEHDTSQDYVEKIAEAGARVMDYQYEYTEINGNRIRILGIDNVYYSPTFDLENAFQKDNSCYNILMAHIPNYEKFADFGADLTLCGDTHGGVIQLPFGKGPVYYAEKEEWLPEIKEARSDIYDKGLFEYENGVMLITSGLGAYPVPARLNNRPEVVVVDIKSNG